jgi:hypothetical protein
VFGTVSALREIFPIGQRVRMTDEARRSFPAVVERSGGKGKVSGYCHLHDCIRVLPDGYKSDDRFGAKFWEPV